jgi:non-canonical (house-cleaning) NTP pyrophosphatase
MVKVMQSRSQLDFITEYTLEVEFRLQPVSPAPPYSQLPQQPMGDMQKRPGATTRAPGASRFPDPHPIGESFHIPQLTTPTH